MHSFDANNLYKVSKPNYVTPMDNPTFRVPKHAEYEPNNILGIGVTFGGHSRFYPLHIIQKHQIINDDYNGVPVSVTFSPLTFTALAFKHKRFGSSGNLYNQNMVMYDKRLGCLVSQMLRRNIDTFTSLNDNIVPSAITTLREWDTHFPGTLILTVGNDNDDFYNFERNPYRFYVQSQTIARLPFRKTKLPKGLLAFQNIPKTPSVIVLHKSRKNYTPRIITYKNWNTPPKEIYEILKDSTRILIPSYLFALVSFFIY